MTIAGWVRVTSWPASLKNLLAKSGSYGVAMTTAGKIELTFANGANSVTLDSLAVLQTNVWYHVACVYNGGYLGPPKFGKTVAGAGGIGIPGDYRAGAAQGSANNLQVCRFQALERGQVTQLSLRLSIEASAPYAQDVAAVAYADAAGPAPGAKLAQSDGQYLVSTTFGGPIPLNNVGSVWVVFPVDFLIAQGIYYWLGFAGGAIHASDTTVLIISDDATGGTRKIKHSQVSVGATGPASQAVADPFGTAASSDAVNFDVFADYTPTGRTGAEQLALIYINGALDNSTSYGHGIADSANALQHASGDAACDLKDWMIWDRPLAPNEIARLYACR